jgi:hypothetical protein
VKAVTLMFDMACLSEAARRSWSEDFTVLIHQLVDDHLTYCLSSACYATGRVWQLTIKDWSTKNFTFLRQFEGLATSIRFYHTYEVCEVENCYQPVAASRCPDLAFWQLHTRTGEVEHEIHDRCMLHCLRASSRAVVQTIEVQSEPPGEQGTISVALWRLRGKWFAQRLCLLSEFAEENGERRGIFEATPWLGPWPGRTDALAAARIHPRTH